MDRKGFLGPVALCTAVLLALPLLGCADADPIGSAVGGVTIKVVPSGGTGRYGTATWGLGSFIFRPADPTAQAALGGQVLSLSGSLLPIDLTGTAAEPSVPLTLAQGTYEVSTLELNQLSLSDWSNVPPPVTCYDLASSPPTQPVAARLITFAPPLTFVVTAKGSHVVELRVDAPALIDAYLTSYQCSGSGALFNYDPAQFNQALYPGVISLVQTQ